MCELFTFFFIQTDSWTQNMQEHKRWDLSHEPITAEHNQSYHITCPHSFSIAPHQTPPQALGGLLKLNGLRGVERCGLLLKLYLLGVAVAQIYFRKRSALNAFYVIFWNNNKKKCFIFALWIFFSSKFFRTQCLPCLLGGNTTDTYIIK